jgi:hypothetical protein
MGWKPSWMIVPFLAAVIIIVMFIFPAFFLDIAGALGLFGISLALMIISLATIGYSIMEARWGLLIDGRNKVSLSKLQMVLWTIVVISGLLAATVFNLANGVKSPLDIVIPPDLWFLMGITTVALVGSPIIKSEKQEKDLLLTNKNAVEAKFSDIFRGEENDNTGRLDLGKVQMFYITIIILLAYTIQLATSFVVNPEDPTKPVTSVLAFPIISTGMVTLLGISNAGYLGYKAASHVDPQDSTSLKNKLKALVDEGDGLANNDKEGAIKAYENALKQDPNYLPAIIGKIQAQGKGAELRTALDGLLK